MARLIRTSITSAETNSCSSLEGIESYANLDTALVQQTNHWYRFFAASTATPNGVTVIAPANVTPPAAGRWIRQGIPALGGNRSQFPVQFPDLCDFGFGEGAVLRMADARQSSASGIALTGVQGPVTSQVAALTDPDPLKRYWAMASFQYRATGAASADVFFYHSFSYDGGSNWNPGGLDLEERTQCFVADQSVHVSAVMPKQLGSDLPGVGVAAGDAELQYRIEAVAIGGAGVTNGSLTLQLFETL